MLTAMTLAPAALWTRVRSAAADRRSIDGLGIPSPVLMERAALCCVREALALRGDRPVWVLCGPGNNGGDGVAIARILRGYGVPAQVFLLAEKTGGELAQQLALAERLGVPVARGLPQEGGEALIVDAMLGTGARPPLREPYVAAVAWANAQPGPRLAVDVPTGIDADSGAAPDVAFRADCTVTFQRSKPGLHVTPGRAFAGRVVVADIGLVAPDDQADGTWLIDPAEVGRWLAGLRPGGHKGERGHVGIVGGSAGTPGAAVLAGAAALRAGAGLVTLASDDAAVQAQLLAHRPELMVQPRGLRPVPGAGAMVVGPGLTRAEDRLGLAELWAEDPRPAVWDASALAEIAGPPAEGRARIVTPHPAEAARLLSARTGEAWTAARVQADRVAAARAIAAAIGAVAVLKGEGTLIAAVDRLAVCVSGAPALATAGSGDCLAGVIAALLARGLPPWQAACAGVHVHGVAGERLSVGAVALEVADAVAEVLAAPPALHPRFPRLALG
jgi:NAD(P)H-hydrate epimerase